MPFDIFISYSRNDERDAHIATLLYDKLRSLELATFIDREEILPGQAFSEQIEVALNSSRIVLGLWSDSSLNREWVVNECRTAKSAKKLVPLLLHSAGRKKIPTEFNDLNYLEFDASSQDNWKRLVGVLEKMLPRPGLGKRFEDSIRPLLIEATSSKSADVETTLRRLAAEMIVVPDYQRDSDQWDEEKKSLFIESIINNLAIPALFFEFNKVTGKEEVVDGQQRLTTLKRFRDNDFALAPTDRAAYISPNCTYYAGKKYSDLPAAFKEAFGLYPLTIITLRDLGEMRLEVFKRINTGGMPLTDQDIRLAYYGEKSRVVTLVRLTGVYDRTRETAVRFVESARRLGVEFPWTDDKAVEAWDEWWSGKEGAKGQGPSEMFLRSLVAADAAALKALLNDDGAMKRANIQNTRTIDDALTAYCAFAVDDERSQRESGTATKLISFEELRDKFFPFFQTCFAQIQSSKNRVTLTRKNYLAVAIGALYAADIDIKRAQKNWKAFELFANDPAGAATTANLIWPRSRGDWSGAGGYFAQAQMAKRYMIKRFA